ncbi:MAG: GAF domain-containing protein [bacterium]|nr:MAG: GAF domain-containing protein [bacterium]
MREHPADQTNEEPITGNKNKAGNTRSIYWHNWFLLAALFLLTTVGLSTALVPSLRTRATHLWPWFNAELILVIALSLAVISTIAYLSRKQRQLLRRLALLDPSDGDALVHTVRSNPRLKSLSNLSIMMAIESDLDTTLNFMANTCIEVFNCERATVMIFEQETGELEVRSVSGRVRENMIGTRQKLGEGIAGWAAAHRQALLLGTCYESQQYPGLELKNPSITSAMVVPIVHDDKLLGVLNLTALSTASKFTSEDLQSLQIFVDRMSVYVSRAEQIYRMRATIKKLQTTRLKLDDKKPASL